jgi:ABC-type phosphate transport system substrate-binding protein
MRALRTVALAGAAAVALSGIAIGAASADPTFNPVLTTDIVAGGSDTLTPLFDQWSKDYVPTSGVGRLASWDAVPPAGGSANIQAKNDANCVSEPRPNGSGAGISELNKNVQTTDGHFCWDIARSSRPITANDGTVSSIALAEDGITYALNGTTNGVANLTLAQLGDIYSCTAGATTWNGSLIGGSSADTIVPVLPQGNSGTRATFLSKIGVTTPGSCVVNADGTQAIEENEGNDNTFITGVDHNGVQHNTADLIWPYSIGEFISQVDKKTQTDVHGNAVLQSMKTSRGVSEAPVINPGTTNASINTAFPLLRTLFAVVRGNSGTVPVYLQPLLGNNDNSGWVCSNATAQADITNLGFLNISNCGALTHF